MLSWTRDLAVIVEDQGGFIKLFGALFLFAVLLLAMRYFFEKFLPGVIHDRQNRKRFHVGEKGRSDRELLQWLRQMKPK